MQTLPVIAVNGVIGAQVSPLDRGFTYGDGVFETCKLSNKKILLWDLHKNRLLKSCERKLSKIMVKISCSIAGAIQSEALCPSAVVNLFSGDVAGPATSFFVFGSSTSQSRLNSADARRIGSTRRR